ncbi:MAG: MBL fold metallo-hydrolase [Acidobacteria bacterium]|nr:MBL fold metallo-hydrolase [Acidobacteriota bacterium]
MRIHKLATCVAILLSIAGRAAAQSATPTSTVNLQIRNIRGNLYMIDDVKGANGNAGGNVTALVGDDGIVLGDSMVAAAAPFIAAVLQKVSAKPVRFVFVTHNHPDHRGGLPVFASTATIIAHPNTLALLSSIDPKTKAAVAPQTAWPDLLVYDHIDLNQNGETIEIRHYPKAHTNSDLVAYFRKANVVQMGDTYFSGMFQFTTPEGGFEGVIALMEDVLARTNADTLFVPGHGPLSKRADLEASLKMLKETRSIAADGIRRGLTVDQLVDTALTGRFERWSHGYIDIKTYFRELYEDLDRAQTTNK